ncbi:MAG: hypothetical protein OXD32_03915, partial [Endozoicomonadaceae bacterium]|nr:hypothetical protein [Endozoicomonadaceae bacterium]
NLTCNREAVAKMAIVGFEFNPLSDMLFDASKPAESVDLPTLNVTDRQLQKAFEALTSLYACFVRDLPIDSLMDSLCSAGVITPEFKKTLYMYPAKCDKNNFLLNRVLLTLNKGCIKDFDKLLEAMEGSENSNAKDLAAKIREKLTEC